MFQTLLKSSRCQHTFCYENVLGTTLEFVTFEKTKKAREACDAALAEIDRLELIYSRFNPGSELNTFLAAPLGHAVKVSPDLHYLLGQSLEWVKHTHGAFHPGSDLFSALWREGAARGHIPEDLEKYLDYFKEDFCRLESTTAIRLFPFGLNFNAIAKGLIVDRAACMAQLYSKHIVLSIGGDICHLGSKPISIKIEDIAVDNARPKLSIKIQNQAVASSGGSRRNFRIKDMDYSHIIDPRSGQSINHILFVTVIAPDCLTADVLATAFSVLTPEESLALADATSGIGCLITDNKYNTYSNSFFDKHVV